MRVRIRASKNSSKVSFWSASDTFVGGVLVWRICEECSLFQFQKRLFASPLAKKSAVLDRGILFSVFWFCDILRL